MSQHTQKLEKPERSLSKLFARLMPPELLSDAQKIWRILLIAFFLRVLLLPLFASHDAMTTGWISTVLLYRGELIASNDPPPIFYLHSAIFGLLGPLLPENIVRLFTSPIAFTAPGLLQAVALDEPGIGLFVSILKLPYLIFDFGVAILLLWIMKESPAKARGSMKLWLFNPVVIYVSYFIAQFDVVAVFFMVLAYYYAKNDRRIPSVIALSLAILFKVFTLGFVPFFVLMFWYRDRGIKARAKTLALASIIVIASFGVLFLLLSIQPVYYESANVALPEHLVNGFFGTTLFNRGAAANPLANGIVTFLSFSVGVRTLGPISDVLFLVPMVYFVLLIGFAYLRDKGFWHLWHVSAVLLLTFYAFSLFHAQWFLWVQPFLAVIVVQHGKKLRTLFALVLGLFFVYIWYWDNAITTTLLTPMVRAAGSWPGPLTFLTSAGIPALFVVNLARSLFSAALLFISFEIVRRNLWRGSRGEQ